MDLQPFNGQSLAVTCIMFAMREITSRPSSIAFLLDGLDGRIARLTGTTSAFGIEMDSLADVVSFGLAPAVLASAWGLSELGRWGWAAGFLYVTAAAIRLARFNIQTGSHPDKRISSEGPARPQPAFRRTIFLSVSPCRGQACGSRSCWFRQS
jgi:CDP-diacylglycerol--serine O-phosphatidyltransferase